MCNMPLLAAEASCIHAMSWDRHEVSMMQVGMHVALTASTFLEESPSQGSQHRTQAEHREPELCGKHGVCRHC